jgi:hypothetical protein
LEEFLVEFCRDPRALCDLIEFLGMGSLGSFDRPVELGAFRGEHKEVDSPLVAGLFKVGMEFRSPIDWLKSHLRQFIFTPTRIGLSEPFDGLHEF